MCASKRKLRRQMCSGKIRYASPKDALRAAERNRHIYYKCEFCGGFHTGHQRARVSQILNMLGKH